jgi:hypothetical protein
MNSGDSDDFGLSAIFVLFNYLKLKVFKEVDHLFISHRASSVRNGFASSKGMTTSGSSGQKQISKTKKTGKSVAPSCSSLLRISDYFP